MKALNERAEAALATPQRMSRRSPGLFRVTWSHFRRSRFGIYGLVFVAILLAIGFFAPVLANNQPVLCRYHGKIYAPAIVEFAWNIPFAKALVKKSPPFNQATFDFKFEFADAASRDPADWAWMPLIPFGPYDTSSRVLEPPGSEHWLGTDETGRDLLARMIYGARVSLLVGFVSVGIATVIGIFFGALAGYFGGIVDILISRFIEVMQCFPEFFLILSIVVWRPPSIWNVMIVIGFVRWTGIARFVRGEFMRQRDSEYAIAARALGAAAPRIVMHHLLPNSLAPVFVMVTFGIANAIILEGALSFLGFGVAPPQASWGGILKSAKDNLETTSHMMFPPCIAIFISVLSYNLVGDALRDAIDPRINRT
ncbi:MAG: ABC transporter permease [Planctomycetota bacterium]